MCPHPTNPPREPQPHPLSEWPPSQETAKPPPATHPKRQPHDRTTPRRQRDRAGASLGGEPTTPSRTARKPHPPQSLLSARRLGPAKPPPTTHPKRQPHDRTTPKAAAGPSRSEPWRRTNHPLAHRAKAPSSPEPPQRVQARSREAQTKPPTLQTPSPKETHRLFEKRASRATNPWTAIVSSNPSSSSHEQSAQCPQQNERHHDRLAAIGDPIHPRPSNTTALPKRSTLWS